MNWAAKNPRWRLRRVRLAPVNGGKPKARKARETLSAPAGGRVASRSGRSSKTKGVLCGKGKRADMENTYWKPIGVGQAKKPFPPHFLNEIGK
jgi:hypothetical protein